MAGLPQKQDSSNIGLKPTSDQRMDIEMGMGSFKDTEIRPDLSPAIEAAKGSQLDDIPPDIEKTDKVPSISCLSMLKTFFILMMKYLDRAYGGQKNESDQSKTLHQIVLTNKNSIGTLPLPFNTFLVRLAVECNMSLDHCSI